MKIGLVFAGGLARGAAQMGFIDGFFSIIPKTDIEIISTSSIGAINGLALSNGNLDTLRDLYLNSHYDNRKMLKNVVKRSLVKDVFNALTKGENTLNIPFYVSLACFSDLSVQYHYLDHRLPGFHYH